MTTRILDANNQERLGNRLVGMVDWNRVGPVDDTDDPVTAEGGDLIVVGDLADDLTIDLPGSTEAGEQIAVYLAGDPDGNSVTIDPGANTINGDANLGLDTQYQFVVLVYDGESQWGISSLGAAGGGVQSVFAATGNVLPNASVSGNNLDLGTGNLTAQEIVAVDGEVASNERIVTDGYFRSGQNSAPSAGTLAAGNFEFWLDPTNGAAVFHIQGKTADSTVVGAAIPLA